MDDSVAALQPDEPPPFWWQAEARDVADDMDAILRRNGINHEELPSSSISGLHHEPMPADVPPFGVRRRLTSPRYKPRPDPANALPEPPSRVSSAKAEAKQASAGGRAGLLAEAARLDASWSETNSMLAGCAKEQEPRVNALL